MNINDKIKITFDILLFTCLMVMGFYLKNSDSLWGLLGILGWVLMLFSGPNLYWSVIEDWPKVYRFNDMQLYIIWALAFSPICILSTYFLFNSDSFLAFGFAVISVLTGVIAFYYICMIIHNILLVKKSASYDEESGSTKMLLGWFSTIALIALSTLFYKNEEVKNLKAPLEISNITSENLNKEVNRLTREGYTGTFTLHNHLNEKILTGYLINGEKRGVWTYFSEGQIESQYEYIVYRTGARCNDGSYSSATGRGACSWHGGVRYWTTEYRRKKIR